MSIGLVLAVLPFLKNSFAGILLASWDLLFFVVFAVLLDPLDHSLFALRTGYKHLTVLDFDSVHQPLIENLPLLALGNKNVPNDVCKLLVVVELGEKDVLLSLIGTLFKSNRMESIDKEALDWKYQKFPQQVVTNDLLEYWYTAAVLCFLKNEF
jgi:hypothetical protein